MICVKFTFFLRLASRLANPFGHPSQVCMQVLVLQTCVDLRRLASPFGQRLKATQNQRTGREYGLVQARFCLFVCLFVCCCCCCSVLLAMNPEAQGSETPLSVKSRVQEFPRHSDVIEQDAELIHKPTKKRPKSEAFEMFEKKGIVIGVVSTEPASNKTRMGGI